MSGLVQATQHVIGLKPMIFRNMYGKRVVIYGKYVKVTVLWFTFIPFYIFQCKK